MGFSVVFSGLQHEMLILGELPWDGAQLCPRPHHSDAVELHEGGEQLWAVLALLPGPRRMWMYSGPCPSGAFLEKVSPI